LKSLSQLPEFKDLEDSILSPSIEKDQSKDDVQEASNINDDE